MRKFYISTDLGLELERFGRFANKCSTLDKVVLDLLLGVQRCLSVCFESIQNTDKLAWRHTLVKYRISSAVRDSENIRSPQLGWESHTWLWIEAFVIWYVTCLIIFYSFSLVSARYDLLAAFPAKSFTSEYLIFLCSNSIIGRFFGISICVIPCLGRRQNSIHFAFLNTITLFKINLYI